MMAVIESRDTDSSDRFPLAPQIASCVIKRWIARTRPLPRVSIGLTGRLARHAKGRLTETNPHTRSVDVTFARATLTVLACWSNKVCQLDHSTICGYFSGPWREAGPVRRCKHQPQIGSDIGRGNFATIGQSPAENYEAEMAERHPCYGPAPHICNH